MNPSRRAFLKNSAYALAAAAVLPTIPSFASEHAGFENTGSQGTGSHGPGSEGPGFEAHRKQKILGLQLYSVRDEMNKDAAGTLQLLAAMGYRYVEHAGYWDRKFYGHTAKDFKKLLDGLGLKMYSGHTIINEEHWDIAKQDFTDRWKYTVEDAAIAGQQFVVTPTIVESWRTDYDTLMRYLEVFNKSGELCKNSGLKFCYHNHNFEFKDKFNGKLLFDLILEHTDPRIVGQQLDTGNMYGAGGRALEIVKKYPGRFELMHVKDETKGEGGMDGYESAILGTGVVGIKEVVKEAGKRGGTFQFIIEQETCRNKTSLECVKEDLGVAKQWGF
ncbi:sugar phosphate isomerase/epimerase family protein [Flavitalea flava]